MALRLMNVACVRDLFVVILHARGASVIIFVYADLYTSHGPWEDWLLFYKYEFHRTFYEWGHFYMKYIEI